MRRSCSARCTKTEKVFHKTMGWRHIGIVKPQTTPLTWAEQGVGANSLVQAI